MTKRLECTRDLPRPGQKPEFRVRIDDKVSLAEHPSDEQLSRLLDRYIKQTVPEPGDKQ